MALWWLVAAWAAGPEAAVAAFYADVDRMRLEVPIAEDAVVYTMDAAGGPLNGHGLEVVGAVNGVLAQWAADGGTIRSEVGPVSCRKKASLAACTTVVAQAFTLDGAPAGGAEVRASFVLERRGGSWTIVHWHESAPTVPT